MNLWMIWINENIHRQRMAVLTLLKVRICHQFITITILCFFLSRAATVLGPDGEWGEWVEGRGHARRLWLWVLQWPSDQILCNILWVESTARLDSLPVQKVPHKMFPVLFSNAWHFTCACALQSMRHHVSVLGLVQTGAVWRDRWWTCWKRASLQRSWTLSLLWWWGTGKSRPWM